MSRHEQHLQTYLKSRKAGNVSSGAKNDRQSAGLAMSSSANKTTPSGSRSRESGSHRVNTKLQARKHSSTAPCSGKSARHSLNSLPDELLLKIFQYLSPSSLLVCSQVCSKWLGLSKEGSLWQAFFPCFPKEVRESLTFEETKAEGFDWMMQFKQSCISTRNKKALGMLKKVAAYTGLPSNTSKCLGFLDVVWKLCITDTSGREHWVTADDSSCFASSVSVRWYSLQLPPLPKLKTLKVYAFVPLFFNRHWKPHTNSATTRSLIIECNLRGAEKNAEGDKTLGSGELITAHVIHPGLLMACWAASWKDGGELAFISLALHHRHLVKLVLRGSQRSIYTPPPHKPILDDVDPQYGLHGYSATVELRNHKGTYWGLQYRELFSEGIAAEFLILNARYLHHGSFTKRLSLPWKTEFFKNILQDVCMLDVTVLDERRTPFWCASSPVRVQAIDASKVEFSVEGERHFIEYHDYVGVLRVELLWDPEGLGTQVDNVEFRLRTSFINSWFGTSY